MKGIDFLLTLLLPSLILLHLIVAPYTKVEESFNLQATHDILKYGVPTRDVGPRLRATYDHVEFPGAVPRTFVGAVVLSGLSQPILALVGMRYGQFVVRALLGMFNAFALLRFRSGVDKAFGRVAARWFVLLLAGQFHVLFYASRTLPNMFAFGFSTLSQAAFLPLPPSKSADPGLKLRSHKLGIYYLVIAGVVFRSELAILLATQLGYLLLTRSTPLTIRTLIPMGVGAAALALVLSVPIDSYFWQRPIWPELSGFIYNAIQGKSSDWGTSPFYAYFLNFLPKLLLNPVILLMGIPLAVYLPSTRQSALGLLLPSLAFVAIYSLQPHKEARFIIYVVPTLTACASMGLAYITTHRSRSLVYAVIFALSVASVPFSALVSTGMLLISSLNYPGGEALYTLYHHLLLSAETYTTPIRVHIDVTSCMTGITLFQSSFPSPPFGTLITDLILSNTTTHPVPSDKSLAHPPIVAFDKTENPDALLLPQFWSNFDYVVTATPETVIGKWDVIEGGTVFAYAGIEVLRPGEVATSRLPVHSKIYADAVKEKVEDVVGDVGEASVDGEGAAELKQLYGRARELGWYGLLREIGRLATGGWWVGPKMEAKIWILKRREGAPGS